MRDPLKIRRLAILLMFACCVTHVNAAQEIFVPSGCRLAERPVIPDGDSISEEQLITSKRALEQYLGDSELFLKCLKRYEDSFGEDIDGDKRVLIITSHNKVVDEMYLAGDEFNVALRKFNRRENP